MATIPIFDGTNYKIWSVKMKTLFISMDLQDTVQHGYDATDKEKRQKDAAALSHIQQGVSDGIFPKIEDATTAKQAWDILFRFSTQEPTRPDDRNALTPKELKEAGANHLIVATLIATVTFTAAFTMPGGYNGNAGPNQGMAVLRSAYFFKFFMVTDTLAMSFSIAAVLIHFFAAISNNRDEVERLVYIAAYLIICATIAMVFAFIAGARAVFPHSSGLTNSVAVIACLPLSAFVFTNIAQRVIGPCVDAIFRSICS